MHSTDLFLGMLDQPCHTAGYVLDPAQCVIAYTWVCAVRVLKAPPRFFLCDLSSTGTLVTTLYFETSLSLDSSAAVLHCYR